ncbi:hypothetical protein YPPY71_0881 [Yersinia pestis PY-71]|uniref:Uncharacterized protein n=1 Tax=Yersinia pestis TaxID=632 RepID=Q8CKP1_YERPE|nr:hypothetical [Yersinia pestis KIM10+]EDR62162.1 conserved hypothetical protein [Yersinia pestis biovar Antiqua str. UG05-0454]EIR66284.1 hypothetical protein YPPY19_1006 [Yersinia pestis PY-19]EIS80297.1 hypothetical protein YPPY71_0881 [Yersinia pestis PY-71]
MIISSLGFFSSLFIWQPNNIGAKNTINFIFEFGMIISSVNELFYNKSIE